MKLFLCLLLITGCAQFPPKKIHNDEVSVRAALDQAQMSYLRGCVDAFQALRLGPGFNSCREKAGAHRLELESIMDYNESNKL